MDSQSTGQTPQSEGAKPGTVFRQMLEVSHTDDDGKRTSTICLSENLDKKFAEAFVGGPGHYRFDEVMVVLSSDRKHGFVLRGNEGIPVLNDQEMQEKIREHVAATLTPVQRKVLGL